MSNTRHTLGRIDISNASGLLSCENASLRKQLKDAQTRLKEAKADAARFTVIARRFDQMRTSRAKKFLQALGIRTDVSDSLEDIIDRVGVDRP